ncbi:hypothetical protein Lal_00035072 [Lupinus albus]|nr:hypothetical protein Lal_00035072 [Lupinus albus]
MLFEGFLHVQDQPNLWILVTNYYNLWEQISIVPYHVSSAVRDNENMTLLILGREKSHVLCTLPKGCSLFDRVETLTSSKCEVLHLDSHLQFVIGFPHKF